MISGNSWEQGVTVPVDPSPPAVQIEELRLQRGQPNSWLHDRRLEPGAAGALRILADWRSSPSRGNKAMPARSRFPGGLSGIVTNRWRSPISSRTPDT
jgi:hypothetical protein